MRNYLSIATVCVTVLGFGGAAALANEDARNVNQDRTNAGETLDNAGERAGETLDNAGERAGESLENAGERLDRAGDRAAGETGTQTYQSASELGPLAEQLVGKSVTNAEGEDIGEIEDLAIGPDQNAYAIVSVDQFLGLGGRDVPVQIDELNMQGEDIVLMSQSSKEALKARPEYDPAMYKSYSDSKDAEDRDL